MPPKLALLLALIFSFLVYRLDSKKDPEVSLALWIPVLWMMRCASRGLTAWLYPGGYSADTIGSPYDRVFFVILIIAGLIVLSRRKVNWKEIFASNAWLLALYAYMGLSILWADSTEISFKRWIRTAGDLVMVLVVLTEGNPLKAIAKLFRRSFVLLIPLSIVLSKYFPDLGRLQHKHWGPDMWIGVATHKNTLGQLCILAGIYFLWNIIRNRGKKDISLDILYLLMTVYLLNGGGHSRSYSSILVLIAACAFYLVMERMRLDPSQIWGYFLGVILSAFILQVASTAFFDSSIYEFIVKLLGKEPTLTGRTDLWRDLIALGMQRPIFGAGYGGFWTPSVNQYVGEAHPWDPGQAHNGYIEIFLHLGVVGLVLFGFAVVSALKGAFRQCRLDFEYGKSRLILLAPALIHNYSESGFIRPTHLIWFTFLLVAVNIWHSSSSRLNTPRKSP